MKPDIKRMKELFDALDINDELEKLAKTFSQNFMIEGEERERTYFINGDSPVFRKTDVIYGA